MFSQLLKCTRNDLDLLDSSCEFLSQCPGWKSLDLLINPANISSAGASYISVSTILLRF